MKSRPLPYREDLKQRSQKLRSNVTDAERKLWSKVRLDKIKGYRFYRQKPIGNYIVDFYCPKAKLIIELDGGQHLENRALAYDETRTSYLGSLGLKVLRFSDIDVLHNIEGVVETVIQNLPQSLFAKEGNPEGTIGVKTEFTGFFLPFVKGD